MAVETAYQHVVLDERGIPVIRGTSMKVTELVVETLAYGWSPEELHFQHPYLSLGQIHSALAYYWDHQEVLDEEIADRLRRVDRARMGMGKEPAPLLAKLKGKGLR